MEDPVLMGQRIAEILALAANQGPIPPTPPREASEEGISLSAALAEAREDVRY
jgi:hypothetical protein